MRNNFDTSSSSVVSPEASYREITELAWESINGIKRYWYIPPLVMDVLMAVFAGGLYAIGGAISTSFPSRDFNFQLTDYLIIPLGIIILLGQQRIALEKLQHDEGRFADFFRFDGVFVQFFLLQIVIIAIHVLASFLETAGLFLGSFNLYRIMILGAIFGSIGLLFECIYHYLGFGVIHQHWSVMEVFTKGLASLKRQRGKILRMLGHILIWIVVFSVLGLLVFSFGLMGALSRLPFALIVMYAITFVLVIRLAVFFELVAAGIYMQDVAREQAKLTESTPE